MAAIGTPGHVDFGFESLRQFILLLEALGFGQTMMNTKLDISASI